ncbi:MAG: Na+/H+ antiporter subunit E [Clostridia bacterium]|nr:Na+/H+ antiporter subunit E [Clostridia bacterium]
MFKKIARYIVILCLYSLVYMVLVENVGWLSFLIGLAVSFIAILFSGKYLLFESYDQLFPMRFWGFLIYVFYLFAKIIQSGIQAAIMTISGKTKLFYSRYESVLNDDFTLDLLANSITLTPGTVTVNRKENVLLVMQLGKEDAGFDSKDINALEKKIKKLVARNEG